MEVKKIFIILGIIVLIAIGYFYVYAKASASMWSLHSKDESPYFVTSEPLLVNKMLLPVGTKIKYKKQHFWEKNEQEEPLKEQDIINVTFKEGETMDWGGVPITSINKYFNPEMTGFTVYADFSTLSKSKETPFSSQWQSCNDNIDITVKNIKDWSFNKENILDIEGCGVNSQRYFSEDLEQQSFLDSFYKELMKVSG